MPQQHSSTIRHKNDETTTTEQLLAKLEEIESQHPSGERESEQSN
jgi:hypothetical protein